MLHLIDRGSRRNRTKAALGGGTRPFYGSVSPERWMQEPLLTGHSEIEAVNCPRDFVDPVVSPLVPIDLPASMRNGENFPPRERQRDIPGAAEEKKVIDDAGDSVTGRCG